MRTHHASTQRGLHTARRQRKDRMNRPLTDYYYYYYYYHAAEQGFPIPGSW